MFSVAYEAAFRFYDQSTFVRYYQMARENINQRVILRRCELQALIANLLYFATLRLIFYQKRLSSWLQVALFDMVSLFATVSYLNIILFVFFTLCSYIIHKFYFEPNTLFSERWLAQISLLEGRQLMPSKFSFQEHNFQSNQWRNRFTGHYQNTTRLAYIQYICNVSLQVFQYCLISNHVFFMVCQILVVERIVVLESIDPLPLWKLTLVTLSGELHLWFYYIAFQCCTYACALFLGMFIVVSLLILHAFERSNALLVKRRTRNYPLTLSIYTRFTTTHTRLFLETICVNRMISKFYFLFILVSFPMNALMMMTLLMGRFKLTMLPFALLIIYLISMVQLFFHFFLVRYNKAIHQHSKTLMHFCASGRLKQICDLRTRLHLNHYVAKFYTSNQYGITNGPLGVVSNRTVARKIFFYFRMFIFSYHFVRRI